MLSTFVSALVDVQCPFVIVWSVVVVSPLEVVLSGLVFEWSWSVVVVSALMVDCIVGSGVDIYVTGVGGGTDICLFCSCCTVLCRSSNCQCSWAMFFCSVTYHVSAATYVWCSKSYWRPESYDRPVTLVVTWLFARVWFVALLEIHTSWSLLFYCRFTSCSSRHLSITRVRALQSHNNSWSCLEFSTPVSSINLRCSLRHRRFMSESTSWKDCVCLSVKIVLTRSGVVVITLALSITSVISESKYPSSRRTTHIGDLRQGVRTYRPFANSIHRAGKITHNTTTCSSSLDGQFDLGTSDQFYPRSSL